MSFLVYDLVLLGIFIIFLARFLYLRRKTVKKDGLLLLYRTEWGMRLIDKVGGKYKKTLDFLSYISVGLGYILMAAMIWLAYTLVKIYLLHPEVVAQIKVPPIMPLIPYIDKFVPFLPPFYFIYWIAILAIIAISHEFAHGIFMRRYNIKIKSTGFGFFPFFLPVFLAAFVEQDEKSMVKAKNYEQRAVLAAGTFANTLTAVVFLGVLALFFAAAFTSAGVSFDDYQYNIVNMSSITMVNGIAVENISYENLAGLVENGTFNDIKTTDQDYVGIKQLMPGENQIALYYSAPAINSELNGAIFEINGQETLSLDSFIKEMEKYSPGDEILIRTKVKGEIQEYNIILGENPNNPEESWLGILFYKQNGNGLMNKILLAMSSFKQNNVYYESRIGEPGIFIYNLLWWLVLISISVALINMLPMGIFDGGRFFYLTVLAITKKEKWAAYSYKFLTWLFLLIVLLLMIFWGIALIF